MTTQGVGRDSEGRGEGEQQEAEVHEKGPVSPQERGEQRNSEWKVTVFPLARHQPRAVGPAALQAQLPEAGKARVPSLWSIFPDPERAHVVC